MVSGKHVVLLLLLFAATSLVMRDIATVTPVPLQGTLDSFPKQLADWKYISDIQQDQRVQKKLGADGALYRLYLDSDNKNFVELYIAYYGAVGVSSTYHSPKNCLPGSGWEIESSRSVAVKSGIDGKDKETVSELLVRNQEQEQLVLYWYQGRGRIIGSEYLEKIFLVFDGILMGRRDGTFVRIMSAVQNGNNIQVIRTRLSGFAGLVMQELQTRVPGTTL